MTPLDLRLLVASVSAFPVFATDAASSPNVDMVRAPDWFLSSKSIQAWKFFLWLSDIGMYMCVRMTIESVLRIVAADASTHITWRVREDETGTGYRLQNHL